ncbi:MAG TPA: SRPBCC family protein [Thermohalobaculum sp.]|nr:SRPBCC family protein [Thermohalobaculum sp.]
MSRNDHDRLQRMQRLPVPADTVWRQIGGFGAMADWHPWIDRVEVVEIDGQTHRHLHMADGELYLERLIEEGERYYTYALLESGMPVDDHRATLSCVPEEGGCHVFWSAYFIATDPAADDMMIGFYEAGLLALDERFGGGTA